MLKEREIAAVDKLEKYGRLAKQFSLHADTREEKELPITELGDEFTYYDGLGDPVTIVLRNFPQQSVEATMEADKLGDV